MNKHTFVGKTSIGNGQNIIIEGPKAMPKY